MSSEQGTPSQNLERYRDSQVVDANYGQHAFSCTAGSMYVTRAGLIHEVWCPVFYSYEPLVAEALCWFYFVFIINTFFVRTAHHL